MCDPVLKLLEWTVDPRTCARPARTGQRSTSSRGALGRGRNSRGRVSASDRQARRALMTSALEAAISELVLGPELESHDSAAVAAFSTITASKKTTEMRSSMLGSSDCSCIGASCDKVSGNCRPSIPRTMARLGAGSTTTSRVSWQSARRARTTCATLRANCWISVHRYGPGSADAGVHTRACAARGTAYRNRCPDRQTSRANARSAGARTRRRVHRGGAHRAIAMRSTSSARTKTTVVQRRCVKRHYSSIGARNTRCATSSSRRWLPVFSASFSPEPAFATPSRERAGNAA